MSSDCISRFGAVGRLPHRHPFVMIDRIVSCQPGQSIEGVVAVGARDRTDWNLTPLLLCESLAQLSKALEVTEDSQHQSISLLASIQIEFSLDLPLEQDILLRVRRKRSLNSMVSYEVEASIGARKVLRGDISRRINAT